MAKKKKQSKVERRENRLRKARQWVLTYEGSHIIRAYRKRFKIDATCALKDLGEIGALSPEKLAVMQQAEALRLQQRRKAREEAEQQASLERFRDSDDQFFFVVIPLRQPGIFETATAQVSRSNKPPSKYRRLNR